MKHWHYKPIGNRKSAEIRALRPSTKANICVIVKSPLNQRTIVRLNRGLFTFLDLRFRRSLWQLDDFVDKLRARKSALSSMINLRDQTYL